FQLFDGSQSWSMGDWNDWLKPNPKEELPRDLPPAEMEKIRKRLDLQQQLAGGTNLGESLLTLLNRESSNLLQGIIIVSDGRSTQFSEQTFEELRARARKA